MRKITALLLTAALALGLTGCGAEEPAERQIYAMDTVMQVSAWGENGEAAVEETEQMLYGLDALLSRTKADSGVSALNRAGGSPVQPDPELLGLLRRAEELSRMTGGAFDITIAPVMDAWGFTTDRRRVPEREELEELLGHVGPDHIHLTEDSCTLDPGTEIDLGGIAKGYASDRVAEIYTAHGVERGMVYLGGNVLAWGDKPDGSAWRVGIQDPRDPEDPNALVGILELKNAFAITSGGYQRNFEADGKVYHHIVDPAVGYPADSGLTSVTVVAEGTDGNGALCDALSTALFVMGEDEALAFWREHRQEFDLILVTEDDRVLVTEGLTGEFRIAEGSGYDEETVS